MTEIFLKLVNMNLSASWLVLVVVLLRLILKKAPKWVHVLLWALVAIRLVFPFSVESAFSMMPKFIGTGELVDDWTSDYVGEVSIISQDSVYYDAAVTAGREPMYDESNGYYVVTAYDQLGEPATVRNTIVPVLTIVWLAGLIGLLIYAVISYWCLRAKIVTAVRLRGNIYQSEHVDSPFVLGVIRPRVYLPFSVGGQDLKYVIAHERAHISRGDHLWKPAGYLILTVHWFNPLLWIAYVLLCRDIELACDEKVIKLLGQEQRADYSQALVSCSVNRRTIAACPVAFGEVGVKERVKTVLNYKRPAFWMVVVALVLCVIVAICFLTNPKKSGEKENDLEQYRTEYIGDAAKVSAIVQRLPYPEGYEYSSIELQTEEEPYELIVFLEGESEGNMEECADIAFDLIENMGRITFKHADSVENIASYLREERTSGEEVNQEKENSELSGETQLTEQKLLGEMTYYLELSARGQQFRDMDESQSTEVLAEYGDLLQGYTLMARETEDGTSGYLLGVYEDNAEESFLYNLRSFERTGPETNGERVQILHEESEEDGYTIWNSHISYSLDKSVILIQPDSSKQSFEAVFYKCLTPEGRAYVTDALARGIALGNCETPYLRVYLISEKYGEISEMIPLTDAEAAAIEAQEKQTLAPGYGFAASLEKDGESIYYTQMTGVPQNVLTLAVEKCGYRFCGADDINGSITKARLECEWLEEPIYAEEDDLKRLKEILSNAEFGYVGKCGYGAKLTIELSNGEELVLFKGCDDCDSMVYGSYGGYFLGDKENEEFWEIFGLSARAEERFEK